MTNRKNEENGRENEKARIDREDLGDHVISVQQKERNMVYSYLAPHLPA